MQSIRFCKIHNFFDELYEGTLWGYFSSSGNDTSHHLSSLTLLDDERSISQNVVSNIIVHDLKNLLYYEYWTDKRKYFYVNYMGDLYFNASFNILTHQHQINVETMSIVNIHQCCFNVDICSKIKVEATYVYRRWQNNVETTFIELLYFKVDDPSLLKMKIETTYVYWCCFNIDKTTLE